MLSRENTQKNKAARKKLFPLVGFKKVINKEVL